MKKTMMLTYAGIIFLLFFVSHAVGNNANSPGTGDNDFDKFFFAGGWLVWIILLPLSVITISLIVQNFMLIRRTHLIPPKIASQIDAVNSPLDARAISSIIGQDTSPLSRSVLVAYSASSDGVGAMETAVGDLLEQDTTRLFRRIEWLHIIGNVAPMLGLFGTVWGMINAFNAIVHAGGQPEPAQLAGGISTALVTTWWGLVVAIPALSAYGILRNRIDSIAADITVLIENHLHTFSKE